jgi:hypothetical protein
MLNFKQFNAVNEADSTKTAVQKIKAQLSEKFDDIANAKVHKQGDINAEVISLNKQAELYTEISALMKTLGGEIKKAEAAKKTPAAQSAAENIY